jgi:hypothetical protein
VVGHQAAEPPVDAKSLQVAGAVQRMQPRGRQRRGVADVVQPRRGDQDLPLVGGEDGGSDPGGLVGDGLDVRPAVAERAQEASAWLLAHWTSDDMRQRYLAANCAR